MRSYITGDGNALNVYLVKKDAKNHRWILKLFELDTKSGLFKNLSKVAANIQKAKEIREKNHARGFSILVACTILSEELTCLNRPRTKTALTSENWVNSPDKESDPKILSTKKSTFSSNDIKSSIKMEKAAFAYPFRGVRVDLPPGGNRVPEKLLEVLPSFIRSKAKKRKVKRSAIAPLGITAPIEATIDLTCYFELNSPKYIALVAGERRVTLTERQADIIHFLHLKALLGMPMIPVSDLCEVEFLGTRPHQWKDRFRGKNGPEILNLGIKSEPGFIGIKIPVRQK